MLLSMSINCTPWSYLSWSNWPVLRLTVKSPDIPLSFLLRYILIGSLFTLTFKDQRNGGDYLRSWQRNWSIEGMIDHIPRGQDLQWNHCYYLQIFLRWEAFNSDTNSSYKEFNSFENSFFLFARIPSFHLFEIPVIILKAQVVRKLCEK